MRNKTTWRRSEEGESETAAGAKKEREKTVSDKKKKCAEGVESSEWVRKWK